MPVPDKPKTEHALTFPPFPPLKPGLVAFKDFKERGIKINPVDSEENAVEVDGWGVPTIPLAKRHDTDACKTNTRRKVEKAADSAGAAAATSAAPGQPKPWWEDWAEQDRKRSQIYIDPKSHVLDRMAMATTEFRKHRNGPPQSTNVAQLWDQFKMFAGLMSITPVWNQTNKEESDEEDDGISDEEDFAADVDMQTQPPAQQQRKKPMPRPPYDQYGKDPIPVSSEAEVRELLEAEHTRKQERALEFLDNIEYETRVYLSSYMREQGLLWAEKNLENMPALLDLFYNFLLKHRVLSDSAKCKRELSLKAALKVVEQAKKELPLTAALARSMPDTFSRACAHKWRNQTQPNPWGNDIWESVGKDEPKAKRQKVEENVVEDPDVEMLISPEIAESKASEEVVDVWGTKEPETASGWATTGGDSEGPTNESAWGVVNSANTTGWGTPPEGAIWSVDDATVGPEPEEDDNAWIMADFKKLEEELGTLPETHEPGFVVWSAKRITATHPANPTKPPISPNASEAERAEDALDRQYAKLVLQPWMGWEMPHDDQELVKPRFKDGSRKPAQLEHDPMTDEITVLCHSSVLDTFVLGMGLGGRWSQLARKEDFTEGKVGGKKRKGKDSKLRYWYADEMQISLVSYHVVAMVPPKSEK